MSSSAGICNASVLFKKQPGTLTLHNRMLVWIAATGGAPQVNVENTRLTALFASKADSPKAMLKVGVTSLPPTTATGSAVVDSAPVDNFNFTFIATPPSAAVGDRELFKAQLSAVIADNRARADALAAAAQPNHKSRAASASAPGTPNPNGGTDTPTGRLDKGKGKDTGTFSPAPAAGGALSSTFALRRQLLESDGQLNALHKALVRSKTITEAEFWEGREDLVEAAAAEQSQKKGRSGEMVDPRPETGDGGEVTVKITPQLIRDIFEEYPAVLRAYNENVPEPLDAQQFWTRYFQSKLFNRNRTANRAAVGAVKDDPIFDRYLGEEDDGVEPKNMSTQQIYSLLDLASTEEDQHESRTQQDVTMRAGRNKEAVPVLRRFNEHSERLLNQSLGVDTRRRTGDINPGDAGARNSYLDDIVLSDLVSASEPDRILLNMQDRTKAPQGADKENGVDLFTEVERERILRNSRTDFADWQPDLAEYRVDKDAVRDGMLDMAESVRAKAQRANRDNSGNNNGMSTGLLNELTTLHASATELLRQFWASVLPPKTNDISAAALATPAMKAAKAERMKGHLEKVLVQIDTLAGQDKDRVEGALEPVKLAVTHAINFFNARAA